MSASKAERLKAARETLANAAGRRIDASLKWDDANARLGECIYKEREAYRALRAIEAEPDGSPAEGGR